MSAEQERLARVRLSHAVEPGDAKVADNVTMVGALRVVEELLGVEESRPEIAARLKSADPERLLSVADRQGIRFVTPADDEWPTRLGDLAHGRLGILESIDAKRPLHLRRDAHVASQRHHQLRGGS